MGRIAMKSWLGIAFMVGALAGCQATGEYSPRNGDLIFQTTSSRQSEAIQLATGSPYSHMGIVYVENGAILVFEAVGPVKSTPLAEWTARGENGHFVVKRLKKADDVLTPANLARMKEIGETRYRGKPYDIHFGWSDDRLYCSELVWKIYRDGAGVKIGAVQKLGDFDLSHPTVRQLMKERYGETIPFGEKVISPAAMFASDLLETVFSN
jgi:uncharacterized protein YycO